MYKLIFKYPIALVLINPYVLFKINTKHFPLNEYMKRKTKRKVMAAGILGLIDSRKKSKKVRKGQKVKNMQKKPKNR